MNFFKNLNKLFILLFLLNINIFVTCDSTKNLTKKIDSIIRQYPSIHAGVEVYSINKKKVIYSKGNSELFIPASNTKIFSSILAFDVLGKDYEFETLVSTDGAMVGNSIEGNLYIIGSGDPTLTSLDIKHLFKSLKKAGVKKINGDFCIDKSAFDSEYFAPGCPIDCIGQSWFNCVDSLIIDRKAVSPSQANIVEFIKDDKLNGMFFDGAKFFESLFEKYKIVLTGKIVFKNFVGDPKNSTILSHKSKKLYELLTIMMKDSDNLYADCIFKKVSAVKYHTIGSWKKSVDALKSLLQSKVGISSEKIKVYDGSGVSRYNLVSPNQIVKLLSWAHRQDYYNCFLKTLPIAGIDGTLKYRMADLAPHVKAKTGTLSGVSALSGYVISGGDTLVFSILNNGYISKSTTPVCKPKIEDAICRLLVG